MFTLSYFACVILTLNVRNAKGVDAIYTINVPELKGRIVAKGYNNTSFAEAINVSRNTLTNYLRQPDMIPYVVMIKTINVLNLSENQILDIFFANNLRLTQENKGAGQSNYHS